MRKLEEFVNEKLKVNKIEKNIMYHPTSKEELINIIIKEIETNGPNCSLNHIDVSNITDMSYLFRGGDANKYQMGHPILSEFDGDVSDWDVSNVTNMRAMFAHSKYNGDISMWNVSNVTNMAFIFYYSPFDGKKGDISNWDVSNVIIMDNMFYNSKFNGDISKWKINPKARGHMTDMFTNSPLEKTLPVWYK